MPTRLYRSNKFDENHKQDSNETLIKIKRLEFKINELNRLIRGFISLNR